ncbi:hypothetical protein PHYBLDRAFT_172264 [Phycomyces blakesleeanus NRRL 1555(-)]|uniref:Uncharacterized protein n=1 Tax=Phycomyces blakesleeanus (strain ATCC 8743b / DSM 1359 / FGSC 10004 / NBRC 33097 / NRRL 1555) TaxID=763407 RepID=A0A167L5B7_PHYB8|nr:hypothetical protein PHYBLDRAFT_172264 [Phycomyces blakesleeanus NRRL 1555(-)]OAD69628.1 hypothetical protein PHYBLDRAFT_172264 [Phycomyces blakesleeanus NRRL 1555(-)]|eukprot:XP_018287668.1 hypothetical protein PHYBLDRAFT_172264 [Phycomyces blakesleeanus NRRL 1555(-)]
MLNPFAHEFKPIQSDPLPTLPKKAVPDKRKENKRRERKKEDNNQEAITVEKTIEQSSSAQTSFTAKNSSQKSKAKSENIQINASINAKPKPAKKTFPSRQTKPNHSSGPHSSFTDPPFQNSSRRHSKKNEETAINLAPIASVFDTPSKFITIETAIHPVFQMRPEQNIERSQKGHFSGTTSGLTKLDHGYERYIDWIERSLKTFNMITIVGMESAVVDVVSMVAILQQRSIGEHEEVETFSIRDGKRWTCGIQVRLH